MDGESRPGGRRFLTNQYGDSSTRRSPITLFAHATPDRQVFLDALQKYFGGDFDYETLYRL
jgi:uncharacterized protein (DUF1810 family)